MAYNSKSNFMRYLEIDFARGISVFCMIIYHFFFTLQYPNSKISFFAIPIASSFIIISGICLHISYSRRKNFMNFLKRGIKLSILSLIITCLSFLFLQRGFIIFGILHFFAFSSFLIYPFLKFLKGSKIFLPLSIISILIGFLISRLEVNSYFLFWLGIRPKNFFTFDFFPLFPWFGVLLFGVFLGRVFYPNGERRFRFKGINSILFKFFAFLGKNSLTIYFLHEPIIILILSFFVPLKLPVKFLG